MRAVIVMWKRQLIRFTRAKARVFISLFQPLLFLVAFGFGFGPVYASAGGGNYMMFLAPGIIAMTILFSSVMNGVETIWDKQFGFLKETLVAPVPRWQIMLGRTLGGATIAIFQGLLVLFVTLLLGFKFVSFIGLLMALGIMFLIAILFTALGIGLASRLDDMQAFPLVVNLLIMPMFFLSGALFALDGLPSILKWITTFNPMVYGVDALRGLLTGVYSVGLIIDLIVLVPLIIIMIIFGAWSFSKIET